MKLFHSVRAGESMQGATETEKPSFGEREIAEYLLPPNCHMQGSWYFLFWPTGWLEREDSRSSDIVSKILHVRGEGLLLTNAESVPHYSGRHKQKNKTKKKLKKKTKPPKQKQHFKLSTQRNLESGLAGWTPCWGSELVPKSATSFPAFGITQDCTASRLSSQREGNWRRMVEVSIQILPPLSGFFTFCICTTGLQPWLRKFCQSRKVRERPWVSDPALPCGQMQIPI